MAAQPVPSRSQFGGEGRSCGRNRERWLLLVRLKKEFTFTAHLCASIRSIRQGSTYLPNPPQNSTTVSSSTQHRLCWLVTFGLSPFFPVSVAVARLLSVADAAAVIIMAVKAAQGHARSVGVVLQNRRSDDS